MYVATILVDVRKVLLNLERKNEKSLSVTDVRVQFYKEQISNSNIKIIKSIGYSTKKATL